MTLTLNIWCSDAVPSSSEELLYSDVSQVLDAFKMVIAELQDYKGAAKEIREVS